MLIFSETYSLVYNHFFLCRSMMYHGVTNLVTENLDRLTKEIIFPNLSSGLEPDPIKRRCEDEKLLEAVYNAWSDHTDSVKKIGHVVKLLVSYSTRALPHSTLNVYSS